MACIGHADQLISSIIPFYVNGMGCEVWIAMFRALLGGQPRASPAWACTCSFGVLPFNLIKGAILTVIAMLVITKS